MTFAAIKAALEATCEALAAAAAGGVAVEGAADDGSCETGGGVSGLRYSSAQQVREDVVRLMRLVTESWPVRQAVRVCCCKVVE